MMQYIINRCVFNNNPPSYAEDLHDLEFVGSEDVSQISCRIPIRYYHEHKDGPTLLMCHGNRSDIGVVDLKTISQTFNANICVFDYAGYGLHSERDSSEEACYRDVLAVYNYLVIHKDLHYNKLFIYGRSSGTAMACYLAHTLCKQGKEPAGLILVSPLMSVFKIFVNFWLPGDRFENYTRAPEITCNIAVLHGNTDTVIPTNHDPTEKQKLRWFVTLEGCGHENVFTSVYYQTIGDFINAILLV